MFNLIVQLGYPEYWYLKCNAYVDMIYKSQPVFYPRNLKYSDASKFFNSPI